MGDINIRFKILSSPILTSKIKVFLCPKLAEVRVVSDSEKLKVAIIISTLFIVPHCNVMWSLMPSNVL